MLTTAKRLTLAGSRLGGLVTLVRNTRWRSRRLLILGFHGISLHDEHEWNPDLYLSPQRFRNRMVTLRNAGYVVLPLSEGLRRLYAGSLPPRSVVLTFDDGTHDFYVRALPTLREFNYPATVFLTTYYCWDQRPVFDPACSYVLWKGRGRSFDSAGILPEAGSVTVRDSRHALQLALRMRGHATMSGASTDAKESILQRLAAELGVDYPRIVDNRLLHIMSPEEVAALPSPLIDVQLHTHRHRTPADRVLFEREIADNVKEIKRLRGRAATLEHFCYPSGHYLPQFLGWLSDSQVRSATTCEPGLAAPSDHPLLLPRLLDSMQLSGRAFESWLSGVGALLTPRRPIRAARTP